MKFKLLLLLLTKFCYSAYSQENLINATDVKSVIYLEKIAYYIDSTNELSIKKIANKYLKKEFIWAKKYGQSIGAGNFNNWFAVEIQNSSSGSKSLVFEIPISRLDSFSVYAYEKGQVIFINKCLGTGFFNSQKPLKSLSHAIEVDIKPNSKIVYFLKLRRFPYTLISDVKIYSKEEFEKFEKKKIIKLTFLGSFFLLELLFCATFFYINKKNYLLYFILLQLIKLFFVCYIFGALSFFEMDWVATNSLILISTFVQYLYLCEFFQLKKYKPILVIIPLVLFSHSIFFPYGKQFSSYSDYLVIFTLIVNFVIIRRIILLIFNREKYAILFFLTQLPTLISIFLNIFNNEFSQINSFFKKNDYDILYYSTLFEILTFSAVLIFRIISLNKAKIDSSLKINTLQSEILQIQDAERRQIAADLHDDLGSTFALIKDRVFQESKNLETHSLIEKAIADLRSVSRNLLPADFELFGFIPSLEKYIAGLNNSTEPLITFIVFGKRRPLKASAELNLYRILIELLHNIKKHSTAKEATVQLIYHEEYLHVSVEEEDSEQEMMDSNLGGIGLKTIQRRLEFLQAKVLEKGKGHKGYSYVFEVPYNENT